MRKVSDVRTIRIRSSFVFKDLMYLRHSNKLLQKLSKTLLSIISQQVLSKKSIIFLPPENITPEMVDTFESFIGWDVTQTFAAVPEPFASDILLKLCKRHGKLDHPDGLPCNFYSILNVEEARNLKLDEEFLAKNNLHVRQLREDEARKTLDGWPYADEDHSEEELKNVIKTLYSAGVFTDQDELACSYIHSTLGLFNGLYTPEKFRRKGLARILTIWMIKKVAQELGTPPIIEAATFNVASAKLQENVGLKEIYKSKWFYYKAG